LKITAFKQWTIALQLSEISGSETPNKTQEVSDVVNTKLFLADVMLPNRKLYEYLI